MIAILPLGLFLIAARDTYREQRFFSRANAMPPGSYSLSGRPCRLGPTTALVVTDPERRRAASPTALLRRSGASAIEQRRADSSRATAFSGNFDNLRLRVEPTTGFEPVTYGLRNRCSTS